MTFIPYPKDPDIFVRSTVELEDYNNTGVYTVGHKFKAVRGISNYGETCLIDAECVDLSLPGIIFATRDQFEIIED